MEYIYIKVRLPSKITSCVDIVNMHQICDINGALYARMRGKDVIIC